MKLLVLVSLFFLGFSMLAHAAALPPDSILSRYDHESIRIVGMGQRFQQGESRVQMGLVARNLRRAMQESAAADEEMRKYQQGTLILWGVSIVLSLLFFAGLIGLLVIATPEVLGVGMLAILAVSLGLTVFQSHITDHLHQAIWLFNRGLLQ